MSENPLDTIARWQPNHAPMPKPSKEKRIKEKAVARAGVEQMKKKAAKEAGLIVEDKPIPAKTMTLVRERDNNTCKVCGLTLGEIRPDGSVVKAIHVDHIIPRAAGGSNCDTNLRCACDKCNLGRGARRAIDAPPPKPPVSEEDKALLAEKDAQTKALIKTVQKPKS